jgi:signal transduction histidine kinase
MINQSEGSIDVESDLGKGTVFHISLAIFALK